VRAFGRDSWWRYRVVEHDAALRHVALRAETALVRTGDTIDVEERPGGSTVVYDAEIHLRGPLRLLDPLLARAFRRIVDDGADGIRRALTMEPARP
jgi:hypothetical protein